MKIVKMDEKKIKIGVILSYEITAGGGFNQALNAVLQILRITKDFYELEVFTTNIGSMERLKSLGIQAKLIRFSVSDEWIRLCSLIKPARYIQKFIKVKGALEVYLKKQNIDIVYFVDPGSSPLMLEELNYIATVWDNCHRDFPDFPELRRDFGFYDRELMISSSISRSIFTVCDSEELRKKLSLRYSVDEERIVEVPFSPSPLIELYRDEIQVHVAKNKSEKKYFFYPAQFWAHKNHIRIVQAYKIAEKSLENINVIFSGGDKGNLSYVRDCVNKYGLGEKFKFLGFVPPQDMSYLYKGAAAVIMPSYFGPTNLPPIEAWSYGVPLIYSNLNAKQAGDAAILVDPNSAAELSEAMQKILEPEISKMLIANGNKRIERLKKEMLVSEMHFMQKLHNFSAVRQCWR